MPESPYPVLTDRVARSEVRLDNHDTAIAALTTTNAVQTEQIVTFKEDIHDLVRAIEKANARVSRILQAVWALVLVLIPVAVGIIAIALGGSS